MTQLDHVGIWRLQRQRNRGRLEGLGEISQINIDLAQQLRLPRTLQEAQKIAPILRKIKIGKRSRRFLQQPREESVARTFDDHRLLGSRRRPAGVRGNQGCHQLFPSLLRNLRQTQMHPRYRFLPK
ncbi:hypothetical protein HPP92_014692 [Vanilla planifolia]|uniref:Uncharacterized protein n=1 Tax=Vanilla planifolia TaxID=51239 RepID=A0A835QQ01_VANPL|nr:hypothetical protein HPP92_015173 [Vanilla planifolia]KAG0475006.1 hypothetical protein HPP92_014692 [Vanilla planifolia]